jgi:uncharacterized protein
LSWLQGATSLTPSAFALIAAITFGAAAIRGLTGFGMAIILVPLLGMIIRPDQAVILAILLQLLIGPVGIRTILADFHRPSATMIAIFAVMTTPIGIWLLAHTAPNLARLLIAGIAIGAFLLVLIPRREPRPPGMPVTLLTGAAAGILTGFAAMPGPPVVPYYIASGFSPVVARASMMFVFFATAIAATLSSWLIGFLEPRIVLTSILLFPAVLAGNWAGGLAFGRIAPALWRTLVGLILGMAGVSAVVRAFG